MSASAWPPRPCGPSSPRRRLAELGGAEPGVRRAGGDCDALYDDLRQSLGAREGCSVSCSATLFYDRDTCHSAPDVGFCLPPSQVGVAKIAVPDLRCATGLPACADGATSCRYAPAGLSDPCGAGAILAYNSAICALVPYASRVVAIPLDEPQDKRGQPS